MILTISCSVFAFIVGSIPFGIVFSRLFGKKDPREVGSGNIGATNVLRSSGNKSIAVLTLIADIVKGSIVVLLANQIQNQYNLVEVSQIVSAVLILMHTKQYFVVFGFLTNQ